MIRTFRREIAFCSQREGAFHRLKSGTLRNQRVEMLCQCSYLTLQLTGSFRWIDQLLCYAVI